ncbi:MAG: hypothetical protein WCZ22_02690 [Dehalococcoidales bacterium]|jgi:hypothetical protein
MILKKREHLLYAQGVIPMESGYRPPLFKVKIKACAVIDISL